MRQRIHRALFCSSLLIAGAAYAPVALGQFQINGAEVVMPPSSNKPSVYVRDSAVAAEKLALAQRMEHLKEWNKSADVYQEIVEKYADRVVPADSSIDPASAKRYMSVTLQVQSLIGKWPAEGLAVYRARYETPAATLLESAGGDDVAILNRVVQIYFPTDAAKKAALRLMDLYIEEGEFSAAGWLGERLLLAHPTLGPDRANVLFRTALAEHLGGNDTAAKAKADELKQNFATAAGTWMGKDVVLADEAVKILASPAPVAHGSATESWPMVGGDATRGRIPEAAGRPGAKVAEIALVRKKYLPTAVAPMQTQLNQMRKDQREYGLSLGMMPVIDRGEIFYQDSGKIYGASVESGLPLAGWTMPGGVENDKRYSDQPMILSPTEQTSVTVTDSSVLGIISQPGRSVVMNDFGVPMVNGRETQLVCLDRSTGAKRWSTSPMGFPDALANLRGLALNGSPLVVGDTVYVSASGGKAMQFEDAYVLAFALADGRLRWSCYLASGNAPGENFAAVMPQAESLTHIAYAGGRVYAVTNLGAVAAVDAYTGTIAWLSIYPTQPQVNNPMLAVAAAQAGSMGARQRKPWAQNPTIVKAGKVFALPSDSTNLLIYDAGSGEEAKRISLGDFDNADTLLGVADEKLIINGPNSIYCINWPAYDSTKGRDDNLVWWKSLSAPGATEAQTKDVVRGRGFVTTDAVFIPTKTGLDRISLGGGKVLETYPHGASSWPSGEGPGNVVVTQDQVVIAGADGIVVYSDLALARAKLDKAIADAPSDPLPRLKYAETLFAAGQMDDAVAKLDEAIGLLGGLNSMRPGPDRDRVFARSLTFAERLADPKVGARDVARILSMFDRAQGAANNPQQQVSWRISRARFSREVLDFTTEVKLYQDILSDPALRSVNVPSPDQNGVLMASVLAEQAIGERLRSTPAAYAPFEQAAKEALETAKQANDATAMLAVAQKYPNATVAINAMFAAADSYEAAGKNRPAVQVLNQLYRKYRDSGVDKPRILEAQARNYLPLPGGLGVAIGRLTEGAKLGGPQLSKPLKLPDGNTIENVTFGAAAELLQKYSAEIATAALPEFNIPVSKRDYKPKTFLPEAVNTLIADVDQIVLPPRDLRKFSRFDRVVTWTKDKGIGIYAVGTNTPLASSSAMLQEPRGGIWMGNDLLIWSSQKLVLLRGDTGATAWQTDVSALPPVDIAAGNAEVAGVAGENNQQPQFRFRGRRQFGDNQIIQLRNGQIIFPNGMQAGGGMAGGGRRGAGAGETLDHVRPVGDRVIVATSSGRISALELGTGQIAWQTRVSDAPFNLVVNSDDYVAARFQDDFGSQIVALETFTGQIVWRRAFTPENGQVPVNMALAADGTLIYTMPDHLCGVDLYEPGKDGKFGDKTNPDGTMVFAGAIGPDQLVAADGRVLALADGGQYVRVMSTDSGKQIGQPLSTGSTNWNVSLRVVGPRLYVINSHAAMGYSLDHPEDTWPGTVDPEQSVVRDAFVGKRHLVLLGQLNGDGVGDGAPAAVGRFHMLAYGRYPKSATQAGEAGRLDQTPTISSPAGIETNQWQPVEGGFYYRSLDRQAHFLKGAATGN